MRTTTALLAILLSVHLLSAGVQIVDEDFEIGNLSAWNLSSTTGAGVSTERSHSGLYSAKHFLSGSTNTLMRLDFAPTSVAFGRVFFFLDPALSAAKDLQIFEILNVSAFAGQRVFLRNGNGAFYLKLEGQATPGSTAISKGTWHAIELKYDSTKGTAALFLDGANAPEVAAAGLTLGPASAVRVGCWGTAAGAVYFDDVAVGTSAIGSPAVNLTVRHPNTFGRSALPLLTTFWGWTVGDQLSTEIAGTEVYRTPGLVSGRNTHSVDLSAVKAGLYTLTVRLLDAQNAIKAQYSETIRKYIDGVPTVSIDANNSIVRNGSLIFPVTPFMQNPPDWASYISGRWVNMYGWASGYSTTYSVAQYGTFLDTIGAPSIGPDSRFCNDTGHCLNSPDALRLASEYASMLKNHPNVFMWTWCDEPDLGGTPPRILPSTIQMVTNAIHSIDPNHPQALNLYGYDPLGTRRKGFLYPNLVSDVYAFDFYPMIYGRTFANWLSAMDQWQQYNFGLTPWFTFIEAGVQPCKDPPACSGGRGPTAAQLRMEAWLAVIHGIKGLSWWGPETGMYTYIAADHKAEMANFVSQIGRLKDLVLSAPPARTMASDSGRPGNRVDTMIREDANNIWVFAARVTELGETDTLMTQFTVSSLAGVAAVKVFDEGRTVTAANGVFSDSFAPNAVHIYSIPKMAGPAAPQGLQVTVR